VGGEHGGGYDEKCASTTKGKEGFEAENIPANGVVQRSPIPTAASAGKLCRWKRHLPPKRRLVLNGLYGVMSQKKELFRYSLSAINVREINYEKLQRTGSYECLAGVHNDTLVNIT
jgi:hypothetical protein